jgi:hypothetical protein
MWHRYGLPFEHVSLCPEEHHSGNVSLESAPLVSHAPDDGGKEPDFRYEVKTMLFADAVGYSRLSEDQIPLFFEHYAGAVARFNETTDFRAEHIETARTQPATMPSVSVTSSMDVTGAGSAFLPT